MPTDCANIAPPVEYEGTEQYFLQHVRRRSVQPTPVTEGRSVIHQALASKAILRGPMHRQPSNDSVSSTFHPDSALEELHYHRERDVGLVVK